MIIALLIIIAAACVTTTTVLVLLYLRLRGVNLVSMELDMRSLYKRRKTQHRVPGAY